MSAIISDQEFKILLINRRFIDGAKPRCNVAIFDNLDALIRIPIHHCDADVLDGKQLSSTMDELRTRFRSRNRSNLLIAGAYLEDQVTVFALQALAEGFDVYMLNEFIVSRQRQFLQTYETRLLQAGAVPTTLRQLLYQWITAEQDQERRAALLGLFELYESSAG